ncbi:MAG: hypothetical protein ACI8RZ_007254 [Myxococcota bacterium]|jgi:hypothetical protein
MSRTPVQAKVAMVANALLATALLGMSAQLISGVLNTWFLVSGQIPPSSYSSTSPEIQIGLGLAFNCMGLGSGLIVIIAASRMKRLTGRTFAIFASILAMLPCISPCCFMGLPVGIWSLMLLLDPTVRDAFDGRLGDMNW